MTMCSSSKLISAICVAWISNFVSVIDSKGAHLQQYFRKEPVSISAVVGSEVTLQCEVEYQSGHVQWTKDGYALGFNRTIPGFPRYRFYADEHQGVFNLNIQNVSLEDDAEFQCQVGPAIKPIIHKPIRAVANLTVIAPPSSVEIVGLRNDSKKVEVLEHHPVTLRCVARKSRPAARLVWYRGRTKLKSDNVGESNVTESEMGRTKIRLYDVTSEIRLQPSQEDDAVNYTCEAIHDALSQSRSLVRDTVQLSVLYPPGLPYIKGYGEGEILRQGQNVDLVCQSRGGNPPAQLVWYRNGEQVRAIYRTIGGVSENVYTFVADMSDNKARFTCEASSVINRTRLTSEVNLTVHYPPAIVTINGTTEARVGDVIPLSCTTAASNPPATIKWLVDGKQVEDSAHRTWLAPDNGWITYSNTTATVQPNKTSVVAICFGINQQLNEKKVATHNITILYPPGKPEIKILAEEKFISAGSQQTLTCSSTGGNPLAALKWYRNDKEMYADSRQFGNTVVSEIKISVNSSDNEAQFKCEAFSPAIDIPHISTVKLPVYFPPIQAKITRRPDELKAGTAAVLTCDVGASNPEPEISWWMNGLEVTENIDKSCKHGLFGGKVCTTELRLSVTADMDGRRYTCQATNVPLQVRVSDVTILNVLYKPTIVELNETTFTEIEGNSLLVPLWVSANPNRIKYTWSKDGVPLIQQAFESTLNITRLQRSDAGVYSCEAVNRMGSATIEFRVVVLYAASILHVTDVVSVGEHQSATLECTVDGNPLSGEHVTWKRTGFPMDKKTNFSFRNITSSLTVYNVTHEDMGSFYCVVDNGIGNETSKPAYLVVEHKPVIDSSEPLTKAAAEIGRTAKLTCKADGAPKVSFSWSKRGVVLPQNTTDKYVMLYRQSNVIEHTSTLLVQNVVNGDYGTYDCTARNKMGVSNHAVKLQPVSAPDPPFQLKTVNVTHDSITITWRPGFDGGETATYRIGYTIDGTSKYRYLDVGNVTVFTVPRLHLATCYNFDVAAHNTYGGSNRTKSDRPACSLSEGPPSLPSRGEVSTDSSVNKLPFAVGLVVALVLVMSNAAVVIFCLVKRSRSSFKGNSTQGINKSENTDLYSSNNFNDQMHAESITSVSEKSENYDKSYNQMDEGRCSALNTYLIEEIDYPFQDTSAYEIEVKPEKLNAYRTSTICRNGSLCQRMDPTNANLTSETQFVMYPPPLQFAQPSLQYVSNQRGHVPCGPPPPDVTVQTAQNVPLTTFNYTTCNSEHDGQLV